MSDRGQKFYNDAEKKLKGFMLFNKEGKYEDAADLFAKSGNAYKSVRDFGKAGDAYAKSAETYLQINHLNDAASQYADAGKNYSKVPELKQKAIEAFRSASRIYRENGKATNAAKLLVEASKIFIENEDLDSAIEALQDAVQLYEDEDQPSSAVPHITTLAEIKSQQKKWLEASNLFKKVADIRLSDRLTQLAAAEFITKSVVCKLAADDVVGAEQLTEDYVNQSPPFVNSREYKLLKGIIEAIKNTNSEDFSTAIYQYDQIKKLDKWYVETLLLVKNRLEGDVEDDELL